MANSKKKPVGGMYLDPAAKYLKDTQARFLLNCERSVNNSDSGGGANEGYLTPVPSNRLLPFTAMPPGTNTRTGSFESKKSGRTYVWVHNSLGNHLLYRINRDLSLQKVFQGPELALSPEPRHAIRNAYVFVVEGREYVVWVDGKNWQGFIDAETAIATASFSHPYFATDDRSRFVQLPTRPPMRCLTAEWLALPDTAFDLSMPNLMVDKSWQFRTQFIYTDGRESAWSRISSAYYVERSVCQADALGLPRCLRLNFDAGGPEVEKIVIAFRTCNGNAYAETNPTDFFQYDVLEKYAAPPTGAFWTRPIDPLIDYNPSDNTIDYIFCGDKECTPIPVSETNRSYNPVPITSYAMCPVEESCTLWNNVVGYDPLPADTIGKFEYSVTPGTDAMCKVEMVEVKFAVLIHNLHRDVNEPVFVMGDDVQTEQKLFGGLMYRALSTPFDNPAAYNQTFYERREGFVGYVEGKEQSYGITRQHRYDGSQLTDWGPHPHFNDGGERREVSRWLRDGMHFVQIGTIKVEKGTCGYIRLAGHNSNLTDSFQDTSTTVIGVYNNYGAYRGRSEIRSDNTDWASKEIFFNTCNGGVDLTNTPFVVADLAGPSGDLTTSKAATAACGYLRDKKGEPVERSHIEAYGGGIGGSSFDSFITDHNGFYFVSWWIRDGIYLLTPIGLRFYVEGGGCSVVSGKKMDINSGFQPDELFVRDAVVEDVADYADKYYAAVRLRVKDCNGVAVPGISVAIRGSKAAVTNAAGIATLKVRSRTWEYGRSYQEPVVVMQSNDCPFTLCDTACVSCMPVFTQTLPACFSQAGAPPEFDIMSNGVPAVVRINPFFNLFRGLKTGGRYGFAPVAHDAAGRHVFIPQLAQYLVMPTIQQQNAFAFPTVGWKINGPLRLPSWVRYLSFYRTDNLAFEDFMQWIADDVFFMDATGAEVPPVVADKVRLSVQSLVDYNDFFSQATNTEYQYKKGDRAVLIADENAKIFPAANGIYDFLIEGNYKNEEVESSDDQPYNTLVIPMESRLRELKPGSLLQITRPKECETAQIFFEICNPLIPVVGGEPTITEGTFETFDTYHVRRSVRYDDSPRGPDRKFRKHAFVFPFEHHSPSDFWGDHCDDRGRVNTKNPYEKQVQYERSIYVSDALLENGNRNGLSTFRNERRKFFKAESRGGITKVFGMNRAIKVLCEFGNFVVEVADQFARTSQDGYLRALPGDALFTDPPAAISMYGLQYEDVEACWFGENFATWFDAYNACVVNDGGNAPTDESSGKIGYHLAEKLRYRDVYNATRSGFNRIRIVAGYDSVSKNVLFTFSGRGFGDGAIANRLYWDAHKNETIAFCVLDKEFPTTFAFTPEGYGRLGKSLSGDVFFSFRDGLPWIHREKTQTSFNEFFGVVTDQRLALEINDAVDKEKVFWSFQLQSSFKFYVERLTTPGGQLSMVPPAKVASAGHRHNASFLRNMNTKGNLAGNALYYGERLKDYTALVHLVRDNTVNNLLGVMDDAKRRRYSTLDSVFFACTYTEQTAYNSNPQ